jgi:hypothetical protein
MIGAFGLLNDRDTAALRQQAYLATRSYLGTQGRPGTPENITVSQIAETYVKEARGRLSGPISAKQILEDANFLALVGGSPAGFGAKDLVAPAVGAVVGYFAFGKKPMGALVGAVAAYLLKGYVK